MGRGAPISDEERGRMKGLYEAEMGVRNIARRLERSPNGVSYVLRAPEKTKKKRGRPRSLTDSQVRQVVRAAATENYSAAELKATYGLSCSVGTVQRLLSRVDYLVYSKMDRTLHLTKEHMLARLEFAQRLSTAAQKEVVWPMIIFSDEKNGYKHFGDTCVARIAATRRAKMREGRSFGSKGKSELVVLEGRQNSGHYIYNVSEHCSRLLTSTSDNASIHSSNETRMFFHEIGVQLLDWPARSPNLNPIENYNSVPELTAAVMKAWNSAKMNELQDLLDTMPARCFEVARKNNDKTHY
ncbi:Transposase [Phytophthora megakarya]|uniref:Transposase n=1 Tax=Phytophthora megakarya TaxID=4795 RepID=A0A225UUK3_9STRA|nr:Transposase [Phytophthora megakarya]